MNKQLLMAINQICAERNLRPQVVIEAVEQALITAYKKNFGGVGNVEARLDPETGDMRIFARLEVVAEEELTDPKTQVTPPQAAQIDPAHASPGDEILIERTPDDFGRIAAQTAKQVIMQRIREAERDAVFDDYADREGELVQGIIRSIDSPTGNVIVSLDGGRAEAILLRADQISNERHRNNAPITAYVSEVIKGPRGATIHLSRTHRNMLRRLLEKEVPEIKQGIVEIKGIAREAGSRSKIAVASTQPGVDPVGSCVGMRGVRVQNIVNELGGEKIDVVEWSQEPERFVANALSPARVSDVLLFHEHDRTAVVVVPDNQLSLAIGKEGQNARLVAKLTGWRIDIKNESEAAAEGLNEVERQRLRSERKERGGKEDLLETARRMLSEGADLDSEKIAAVEAQAIEAARAEAERIEPLTSQPTYDDLLASVVLPDEQTPALEDLLGAAERSAETAASSVEPLTSKPTLPEPAPAPSEEEDFRTLAAKLARAMTSFDAQSDSEFEAERQAFARLFGADEEESEADKKRRKKGRGAETRPVRPAAKGGPARTAPKPASRRGGYGLDDDEE
jgi:N utilization substance protein A